MFNIQHYTSLRHHGSFISFLAVIQFDYQLPVVAVSVSVGVEAGLVSGGGVDYIMFCVATLPTYQCWLLFLLLIPGQYCPAQLTRITHINQQQSSSRLPAGKLQKPGR